MNFTLIWWSGDLRGTINFQHVQEKRWSGRSRWFSPHQAWGMHSSTPQTTRKSSFLLLLGFIQNYFRPDFVYLYYNCRGEKKILDPGCSAIFFFFLIKETLRICSSHCSQGWNFLCRHRLEKNMLPQPCPFLWLQPEWGVSQLLLCLLPTPPSHGAVKCKFLVDFLIISSFWEDREGGREARREGRLSLARFPTRIIAGAFCFLWAVLCTLFLLDLKWSGRYFHISLFFFTLCCFLIDTFLHKPAGWSEHIYPKKTSPPPPTPNIPPPKTLVQMRRRF